MNKTIKKIKIMFWVTFAKVWDLRPRLLLAKHYDYPIAYTPLVVGQTKYEYPKGIKILYEWEEKGHKWIVFSR